MVYKNAAETNEFATQIQAMDIPNEINDGYSQPVTVGFAQDLQNAAVRRNAPRTITSLSSSSRSCTVRLSCPVPKRAVAVAVGHVACG